VSDPLFLYGTLCHPPLLRIVLGRDAETRPACLSGHRVMWVENAAFPVIEPCEGGVAEGLLLSGLTKADMARLDFYEGGYGYRTHAVTVTTETGPCASRVYMPEPGRFTAAAPWSLSDWVRQWGALTCRAAEEAMGYMGRKTPEELAAIFPAIRTRAAAWLAGKAENRTGGGLTMPPAGRPVETRDLRRPYAAFFAIEEHDLVVPRFADRPPVEMRRAVFMSADAALVLPYDPATDRVLVTEQFRAGPHARGEAQAWTLEPVAGRVDPGETPEAAAHREGAEEAGLTFRALIPVSRCYPSPGASSEYYHLFLGLTDLPEATDHIGGLAGEGEDIRSHVFDATRFIEMCDTGRIWVAPLVLMGHWLARHRDGLRAQASATVATKP